MHEDKKVSGISDPTHQDKDIHLRMVVISVVSVLIVTVVTAIGCAYLLKQYMRSHRDAQADVSVFAHAAQLPPEPRLQVGGRTELQQHRAHEAQLLEHYAWIDEASGAVRIPIDRAMELIVAEGQPVRTEPMPVEEEPVTQPSSDEPAQTEQP